MCTVCTLCVSKGCVGGCICGCGSVCGGVSEIVCIVCALVVCVCVWICAMSLNPERNGESLIAVVSVVLGLKSAIKKVGGICMCICSSSLSLVKYPKAPSLSLPLSRSLPEVCITTGMAEIVAISCVARIRLRFSIKAS